MSGVIAMMTMQELVEQIADEHTPELLECIATREIGRRSEGKATTSDAHERRECVTITLRDYQERSVSETLEALDQGENPCLMLPTGTGKSVVLARLCERLVIERGEKVLMLTHVQELIEQNAKRLHDYWRGQVGTYAPLGVYSAGLKQKELGRAITYAGVQSIATRAEELARIGVDTIIVDEAHLIPTKGEGRYRQLFSALPGAKRIGLTATPWRLGHGSLTEGEGVMFSKLLTPEGTSVREMVDAGHLAPLRSKHTDAQLIELVGAVAKRGGDYVESELAAAVDKAEPNELIAREIVARGQERNHWLIFCVSVDHARNMARILTELGYPCGVVHGGMSSLERVDTLTAFRMGELRAVANVNVLTTGYDFPSIDLMAFCRPTLSPVLYVQSAGRGMRPAPGKENCLVLDFAGLVKTHGPITDVRPPRTKGVSSGEIPTKVCPVCSEVVLISCMVCPSCAHEWEAPQKKAVLHTDDIMAERRKDGAADVIGWHWFVHTAMTTGKRMLACEYQFSCEVWPKVAEGEEAPRKPITRASEFFTVWHDGDTGKWARKKLEKRAEQCGVSVCASTGELLARLNAATPPATCKLSLKDGWVRVGNAKWTEKQGAAA